MASAEHRRVAELQVKIAGLHAGGSAVRADGTYLDKQSAEGTLQTRHRESVVSFIFELGEDFGLHAQAATLAVNYFDRYCASITRQGTAIPKDRVQLIAMTCLLMSAKFFDRRTPSIIDMCTISQSAYEESEFRALELEMLSRLQWLLLVPLPHAFCSMLLRALVPDASLGSKLAERSTFFVDLSVYDYKFLKYAPAVVAAAALRCASRFEARPERAAALAQLEPCCVKCDIETADVRKCADELMTYYIATFPDSPKPRDWSFTPVVEDRADSERSESPDGVMAVL